MIPAALNLPTIGLYVAGVFELYALVLVLLAAYVTRRK